MEKLLESYLANQLVSVHELATGQIGAVVVNSEGKSYWLRFVSELESKPVTYTVIVAVVAAVLTIVFT